MAVGFHREGDRWVGVAGLNSTIKVALVSAVLPCFSTSGNNSPLSKTNPNVPNVHCRRDPDLPLLQPEPGLGLAIPGLGT